MSLIDPSSPEGFFHMRLVPFKARLLEEGKSFFPKGPDPDQESYFEEPLPAANADRIETGTDSVTSRKMLEKLRAGWETEGEALLIEMTENLESLRQKIVNAQPLEEEEEISDFVYPLF